MTQEIRELIDRILSSYDEIDARFTSAGGLGSILSLYEQVRRELERVSFQELDRMTGEIKNVIEALLTIDWRERRPRQRPKRIRRRRHLPGRQRDDGDEEEGEDAGKKQSGSRHDAQLTRLRYSRPTWCPGCFGRADDRREGRPFHGPVAFEAVRSHGALESHGRHLSGHRRKTTAAFGRQRQRTTTSPAPASSQAV